MKVALLSDVHGNLIALDAVLSDIKSANPDTIICLGDVAATGPQPHGALARMRDLNVPVVMGNTDEWLLDPTHEDAEDVLARVIAEIDQWCRRQLSLDDLEHIGTFQPTSKSTLLAAAPCSVSTAPHVRPQTRSMQRHPRRCATKCWPVSRRRCWPAGTRTLREHCH